MCVYARVPLALYYYILGEAVTCVRGAHTAYVPFSTRSQAEARNIDSLDYYFTLGIDTRAANARTANYKSPHKERAGASETEPPFSTKSTPPGARTRGEEKWSLLSALICNWVSCCNTSDGFEEVDCKHCVRNPPPVLF